MPTEKKTLSYRSVGPKIRSETAEWYTKHFDTLNTGATWVLEELPHLYRVTLSELRGVFTKGELGMLLDVLNGQPMLVYSGSGLAGQHISLSVYDSFALYPGVYEDKWGVQAETLNEKLKKLPRWQLACLEIWASGFWVQCETVELTEWVAQLA